jgi:hypothetical protein
MHPFFLTHDYAARDLHNDSIFTKAYKFSFMRKYLFVTVAIILTACSVSARQKQLPRIAIAGLGIESSTFSPAQQMKQLFMRNMVLKFLMYILFFPLIRRFVRAPFGFQLWKDMHFREGLLPGKLMSHS